MAVLLELLEQVAEPARDHASGGATGQQAAQSALENITETAAHAATRRHVAGYWRRRRSCAGLAATEMFDRLPGQQRQDRHGHRRHSSARLRAGITGAARAVLHPVEYV